jgi:hypothetical protein
MTANMTIAAPVVGKSEQLMAAVGREPANVDVLAAAVLSLIHLERR